MFVYNYERKRNFVGIKVNRGLSVIELLVVLVIISILFGVGFMSYRDYARKQTVTAAARQMESDIRLARQMAFEGRKPEAEGCDNDDDDGTIDVLNGYVLEVDEANSTYNIYAVCNGNQNYMLKEDVGIGKGLSLDSEPANIIMFKSVGQGVVIPVAGEHSNNITVTITQQTTGYNAELNIGTNVTITPSY